MSTMQEHIAKLRATLDRFSIPEPNTGCHLWFGARTNDGYGKLQARRTPEAPRQFLYAHRLSFEISTGIAPDGGIVCHRCDNPPCINPDHLYLGDYDSNNRDAAWRHRKRQKHHDLPPFVNVERGGRYVVQRLVKGVKVVFLTTRDLAAAREMSDHLLAEVRQ
jgi:hypothetical protein